MLRVLGAFNLTSPTTAPAQLLRAMILERSTPLSHDTVSVVWDGPDSHRDVSLMSAALRCMRVKQPDKAAAISDAHVSSRERQREATVACHGN